MTHNACVFSVDPVDGGPADHPALRAVCTNLKCSDTLPWPRICSMSDCVCWAMSEGQCAHCGAPVDVIPLADLCRCGCERAKHEIAWRKGACDGERDEFNAPAARVAAGLRVVYRCECKGFVGYEG